MSRSNEDNEANFHMANRHLELTEFLSDFRDDYDDIKRKFELWQEDGMPSWSNLTESEREKYS